MKKGQVETQREREVKSENVPIKNFHLIIQSFLFAFKTWTIFIKHKDMNCHWPRESSSFKISAEARELRREFEPEHD